MASSASARAGINIALIKYWGKRDDALNLPSVGSLSLTIDTFVTETTVTFAASQPDDVFVLNGRQQDDKRVFVLIDQLRQLAGVDIRAVVESTNTVPTASGLASSASGTAALALAAWSALGLDTSDLTANRDFLDVVRRGSGSAPRSLLPGLVRLDKANGRLSPLWYDDTWPLRMVIARTTNERKAVSSRVGMTHSRETSPYFDPWIEQHSAQLDAAETAVHDRDLQRLGELMEVSTMRMHACMLASDPPLRYLKGTTLDLMDAVEGLRQSGVGAWYTMDAGPHVKVLCLAKDAEAVAQSLSEIVGAEFVDITRPGTGAQLIEP
ncbi:MAG: diphosphomevalonate decarboxylase [Bradymonadia bacterium]